MEDRPTACFTSPKALQKRPWITFARLDETTSTAVLDELVATYGETVPDHTLGGSDSDDPAEKIHYYNIGSGYAFGANRFALNYGRQRGGLICVGGVCRFVPESSGFTANLILAF